MSHKLPTEITDDMKYLRFVEFKTLQEIGDKYGISRERVRQLIGNTPHIRTARTVRNKYAKREESHERTGASGTPEAIPAGDLVTG